MKDYYAILGVSPEASLRAIKKAYRRLARRHHPDLHQGNKQEEERFKEIGEAYRVLADPKRRADYDRARNREQLGISSFGGTSTWTRGSGVEAIISRFMEGLRGWRPKGPPA